VAVPTVGLALIARDEEANLPHLLASIDGAFDQVALLDTGSSDRTVEIFEEWAAGQDLPLGHRIGRFEWCDDFAAARNAADELLSTDWLAWADCDDVIEGAQDLCGAVARMPTDVAVLLCAYQMEHPSGPVCATHRQRVFRRPAPAWRGRVHESRAIDPSRRPEAGVRVLPEVAYWRTARDGMRESSQRRNAAILQRWIEEEPENPRPLGMLAAQSYVHGDRREGLSLFFRYVELRRPRMSFDQFGLAVWALAQLKVVAALSAQDAVAFAPGFISILLGRPPETWHSAIAEPLDA